jgi:hypothetical protein
MSELDKLKSTQTLEINDGESSCTLHLLELELPDPNKNPSNIIAHLCVQSDVQIDDIRETLANRVFFHILYTPNLRQRRIKEGVDYAEGGAGGDFIFLDRYKSETIVGNQRYLAGLVAVNTYDFTDLKGKEASEYDLPDQKLNPYDFYISAQTSKEIARLGLE